MKSLYYIGPTDADCLTNKKSKLLLLLKSLKHKPSIIAVTAIKPKTSNYELNVSEISVDGYSNFENATSREIVV